ncbi:MAG: shikimate dehydrogenase [Bacteroidetes bacterium]|nr:shikimate dehydrogenase [Bacteroidota bacterium]
MHKLGLIGYPLSHSFSKKYFNEKFTSENVEGWQYELYPLQNIEELFPLIKTENIMGLNVTIPYKTSVLKYLDELSAEAAEIGAVNTIKVSKVEGKTYLKGYNTDAFAFMDSIENHPELNTKKALVLGNGGAAKAVQWALNKMEIPFKIVARNNAFDFTYQSLNKNIIEEYQFIINTTPVGTAPDENLPAIPYQYITPKHFLYDLVYNPAITGFMQKGILEGATVKNGYQMLTLQAERAWEIWRK